MQHLALSDTCAWGHTGATSDSMCTCAALAVSQASMCEPAWPVQPMCHFSAVDR